MFLKKRSMRIFFFWIILLLLSGDVPAQERLLFSNSCNYTGEISPVEDLYGFASDSEADDAMRRIMRYTGLPANFTIKAANVPNAAAVIYEEQRYILYNQYFMLRIKDQTKTDWAALSILAHEIGHHLSGHTLDNKGSRPDKELEADRFSGFVLYKMGATLDEARIAMETLAMDAGTSTHPPKSARLAAVTNGWLEAKQQNEDVSPIRPATPVKTKTEDMTPRSPIDPQTATATFKQVWLEENVEEGGEAGVRVHAHFNVRNLFGENCKAVAWFYDARTGEPLKDQNGKFATGTGEVSVSVDFVPNYLSADFTDVPFFIPYDELHLPEGEHTVKFQIGLFHQLPGDQMQQIGSASTFSSFEYTVLPPVPTALYRKLWVDFDVFEGIKKGMRIHLQFNLKNLKGTACRAAVWFYFDSGQPLLDYNGRYNTVDGKVSVGTDFLPTYDSSDFNDLVLFIPYDEFHLTSGEYSLFLEANLFAEQGTTYVELGKGFGKYPFVLTK